MTTKVVIFFHTLEAPNVQLQYAQEAFKHFAKASGTHSSEIWDRRKNPAPYRDDFLQELIFGKAYSRCTLEVRERHANTLVTELLFILIDLLPWLSHLAIDASVHQTVDQIQALKALGVSHLPLRRIEVKGALYTGWLSSQIIIHSSYLQHLSLYHGTSLPEMLHLHTLHLRKFRMSIEQPKSMISFCIGQLGTFTYETSEIVARHIDQNSSFMIQAHDAIQALETHNKSLESLHLDLRIRTHVSRDTKIGPKPVLKYFTALQKLFINTDAVYNTQSFESQLSNDVPLTQFLPPNIVSLHLVELDIPSSSERL
ncbi:unnamed protein product [Fusarium graminearum]|uniref:Uncharacterized protein n=1 Tax=Gibberella zeae TaxID=5518 RepID=A0A9N8WVC5_GIBZA|nr:unnamed protein product [Fusarium graminearum]